MGLSGVDAGSEDGEDKASCALAFPFATTQLLPMSGRPASFAFVLSSSSLPLVLYTFVSHASIFWALWPHPAAPPRCKTQAESESESEIEDWGIGGILVPFGNIEASWGGPPVAS